MTDTHHQHVELSYEPALPIPRGKLCLWLFLSTEIMFFAGLIGSYIVLRFGVPEIALDGHAFHTYKLCSQDERYLTIVTSHTDF